MFCVIACCILALGFAVHAEEKWPSLTQDEQKAAEGTIVLNNVEYPYMVYLAADKNNEFVCGGAAINAFFVLTTAECLVLPWKHVAELLDEKTHYVGIGDSSVQSQPGSAQERRIRYFFIHPEYIKTKGLHSIGLIKIVRPFDMGEKTAERAMLSSGICEADTPVWMAYPACMLVEWGKTDGTELHTRPLRCRTVPLINTTLCDALHRDLKFKPSDTLHICSRDPMTWEVPCGEDGGGLLLCGPRYFRKLYGIMHRRGVGCGRYPNPEVYTKISIYRDWIESVVNRTHQQAVFRNYVNSLKENSCQKLCFSFLINIMMVLTAMYI